MKSFFVIIKYIKKLFMIYGWIPVLCGNINNHHIIVTILLIIIIYIVLKINKCFKKSDPMKHQTSDELSKLQQKTFFIITHKMRLVINKRKKENALKCIVYYNLKT